MKASIFNPHHFLPFFAFASSCFLGSGFLEVSVVVFGASGLPFFTSSVFLAPAPVVFLGGESGFLTGSFFLVVSVVFFGSV